MKHFQEEHEQNIKFYVCEDNIDNVKQTIARNYGESDEATKTYLGNLESQKAEMLSKNNELVEKRNLVLTVFFSHKKIVGNQQIRPKGFCPFLCQFSIPERKNETGKPRNKKI